MRHRWIPIGADERVPSARDAFVRHTEDCTDAPERNGRHLSAHLNRPTSCEQSEDTVGQSRFSPCLQLSWHRNWVLFPEENKGTRHSRIRECIMLPYGVDWSQ